MSSTSARNPASDRAAHHVRRVSVALAVSAVALLSLAGSASGASFAADPGSLGAIPDDGTAPGGCPGSYGSNRDVTFAVAGVGSPIEDVAVSLTLNPPHTWVGDLSVVLSAPGGSPSHTVFERTGATPSDEEGDAANVAGPYTFSDAPDALSWWEVAAATDAGSAIPSAFPYAPSTPGGEAFPPVAGASTLFTPVFSAATPNGTWTLRFRDNCGPADTGSVSAATLSLEPEAPSPPPPPPAPQSTPRDMIPPDTTITGHPKNKTKKKIASFVFSSSKPDSTYECSLDVGAFAPCTSPETEKVRKGKHEFAVVAIDQAGNRDATPAEDSWKVKKKKKK